MKQYELPVTPPVFRLKGGTLAATVLELAANAPAALAAELARKVAHSPQLLHHSPLIIALDKLADDDGILDLAALLDACRALQLQPVAVRAVRMQDIAQARALGIAVLPPSRGRERDFAPRDAAADGVAASAGLDVPTQQPPATCSGTEDARPAPRPTRIVTQPVRGGQQVYADGDLVLLAPVSAGAEVIAEGHIHCYAALRGRALAGVSGDASARVFCRELAAELVSIAGRYRIAEDLKADPLWGHAVQFSLREDQLTLAAL